MAVPLKLGISDPMLVKPKCVREAVVFFNFRKNFQLFVYNFLKKTTASQTHFGFTNMGLEMLSFKGIAIWNKKFRFGSPCTYYKSTTLPIWSLKSHFMNSSLEKNFPHQGKLPCHLVWRYFQSKLYKLILLLFTTFAGYF